jgi:hypothetical protein
VSIIIERAITVKNDKALLDNPLYLYVGDGDITCIFTINEIRKAAKFGAVNTTNLITESASYGEIRIYKPDSTLVFTNRAEIIDDRLQAIISFDNLDEYTEAGIHQLQIHLYDESNGERNRFTIPPIELNVLAPVGSDTDLVDQAITGFAMLDSRAKEEPTFIDGSYNKTVWELGNIITKNKLNKIEDAIDTINTNMSNKANVYHEHDEYAAYTHTHNEYATNTDLSSLQTAMNGLTLWYGTQEQYDNIYYKNPNTLYFIKEE